MTESLRLQPVCVHVVLSCVLCSCMQRHLKHAMEGEGVVVPCVHGIVVPCVHGIVVPCAHGVVLHVCDGECTRRHLVFMCTWCRCAMCVWCCCAMCDLHACDGELQLGTERWGGVRGDEKKREGDDGQKGKNYTVLWLVADGRLLSLSACRQLRVRVKAS